MSLNNGSSSHFSGNPDDIESPEKQPIKTSLSRKAASIPSDSLGTSLELVSLLSHLALFGIMGTLIRFSTDILFGPDVGRITESTSILFLDLPANMIGCFIMGFVGFVFKKDLIDYSEHLAIGLSTGLCGSITTFASWNQRLLSIMADNLWQQAFAGFIVGASLSYVSFIVGVDLASGLKHIIQSRSLNKQDSPPEEKQKSTHEIIASQLNKLNRKWVLLLLFLASSALLWIGSIVGTLLSSNCMKIKKMCLGCALAPFGVWIRWYLSRYNFIDVGKPGRLKWFPLGTFAANTSACIMESVVSIVNIIVAKSSGNYIVGGIQLGFLGCMSTVSTLVVESHNLHNGEKKIRSYVYYLSTVFVAVITGIFIYAVPIWTTNYESRYNKLQLC